MGDAKLIGIEELPIEKVEFGERVRPVSEAALESLIASINEIGHMADEIHVRKMKGGVYKLIAGGHRLAAAHCLDWTTIRAKVWECSATWARLWELDDNLAHAELDALELATFLAERKRVYLKLHPEKATFAGAGAAARWDATDTMSLASTIAEKRGISERHVYRLLAAGEALNHNQIRWLRDAPKRPTLADLQAIAKEGDEHERSQAIIAFSNGEAPTVKKALAARKVKVAVKDPVELEHHGLLNAFRRASKEAKRRFVRDMADELRALLPSDTEAEVVPFLRGTEL